MQFTPFEEHSSSAAAPHHCGRCLLVVTLHPCVTARSRRSYRTRDRSYPLEQALENVSVTTHTKTAPEPSSLSQRRTTLPWRPAGSETDTPRCDILRHTLPSESTARAHSRRSMRIEALEHLHSIPRSRRSGYAEHCTHGVSVNLTTCTPQTRTNQESVPNPRGRRRRYETWHRGTCRSSRGHSSPNITCFHWTRIQASLCSCRASHARPEISHVRGRDMSVTKDRRSVTELYPAVTSSRRSRCQNLRSPETEQQRLLQGLTPPTSLYRVPPLPAVHTAFLPWALFLFEVSDDRLLPRLLARLHSVKPYSGACCTIRQPTFRATHPSSRSHPLPK